MPLRIETFRNDSGGSSVYKAVSHPLAAEPAKALVAKREMTVWQYAVRKNSNGDLEQAPLHQVGLLANNSLRIEPYATPLKVLPHD